MFFNESYFTFYLKKDSNFCPQLLKVCFAEHIIFKQNNITYSLTVRLIVDDYQHNGSSMFWISDWFLINTDLIMLQLLRSFVFFTAYINNNCPAEQEDLQLK